METHGVDSSAVEVAEALPGLALAGIELSDVGALVVGAIDAEAVVAALGRLRSTETSLRWVVGDLFLALVDEADGDQAPAVQAVAALNYSPAWLASSVEVARRVPAGHRRPSLSWGHHEVVARGSVPVDDQPGWLARAVTNRWSIRGLALAVDEWERREQQRMDLGGPPPSWKMPPRLRRTLEEAAAQDPDRWLLVHPKTGQVRSAAAEPSPPIDVQGSVS